MNFFKLSNLIITITLIFLSCFAVSCSNTIADIDLSTTSTGSVSVEKSNVTISKMGPMDSTTVGNLKEPEKGFVRLVVKSIRNGAPSSFNVLDINSDGKLEIQGNGYYKFSKDEGSNIWNLEIVGSTIQTFKVQQKSHESQFASTSAKFRVLGIIFIVIGIFCLIFTLGLFGWSIIGIGILSCIIGYIIGLI